MSRSKKKVSSKSISTAEINSSTKANTPNEIVTANAAPTRPPPTVNVLAHRIRYLNCIPQSILCMKCIPSSSLAYSSRIIVICRTGGSVEILNAFEKFRVLSTIPGMPSRDVTCISFLRTNNHDNTTYHRSSLPILTNYAVVGGSSTDGTIFLLNFCTQTHTHVTHLGGGAVFSMESIAQHQLIAVGCEDGIIRILSLGDTYYNNTNNMTQSQSLELLSTLVTNAPVLSIAWWSSSTQKKVNEDLDDNDYSKEEGDVTTHGFLYGGCADGTIRKFNCAIHEAHKNNSSTTSTSTLLLAVPSRSPQFTASSTATLRITAETFGSTSTPTKIWTCVCTSSGESASHHQLVTGNSLGQIQFWDGHTGTLLQTLDQNDNQASVLTLVTNRDQTKLFASGVDPRVACISRVRTTTTTTKMNKNNVTTPWIATEAYRPHTHQVNSLLILPSASPSSSSSSSASNNSAEILVSGGMDTKLCTYLVSPSTTSITPSRRYYHHRPRHIHLWPSSSEGNHPIHLATTPPNNAADSSSRKDGQAIIGVLRHNAVDLYRLSDITQQDQDSLLIGSNHQDSNYYSRKVSPNLLLNFQVQSRYNLSCMALSSTYLAINDASGTQVFHLSYQDVDSNSSTMSIAPQQVTLLNKIGVDNDSTINHNKKMCSCMKFYGKYLFCALSEGPILVYSASSMVDNLPTLSLIHTFTEHLPRMEEDNDEGNVAPDMTLPITRLDVSKNGQYLVAGRNISGISAVHVFTLFQQATEGMDAVDATFSHWWNIPLMADIPSHTTVKFAGDVELIIACVDNTFYIVDVETRSLSQWSLDMGIPLELPEELVGFRKDYPTSIAINPISSNTTSAEKPKSQFLLVSSTGSSMS